MDVLGSLLTVIDVDFWYNRHLGNDVSDQVAIEWIGNEWSKLLANTKSLQIRHICDKSERRRHLEHTGRDGAIYIGQLIARLVDHNN